MSIATAFRSVNKALAFETRHKTLELYRSLLKATRPYPHVHVLKSEIRGQFKKNKYNTSRPKVLEQLQEAEKTLEVLNKGTQDNSLNNKILAYIERYCIPKWNKTPYVERKKKPSKRVKRKPYQVAILVTAANGYKFKRVRGWRQPVKTAMMLKSRTKTNQARLDKLNKLQDQLDMIKSEQKFLHDLQCLSKDEWSGIETSIQMQILTIRKSNISKMKVINKG